MSTMAAVASQHVQAPDGSKPTSIANGNANSDFINGYGALPDSPASNNAPPAQQVPPVSKKTKGKKPIDPNETGKLLAAKIHQLELDAEGEKDQELETGKQT